MAPTFSSLNLVLLGPPGSGKGTQARLLAERYQLPHISTGDMLWGEVTNGTGLGGEVHPDLGRGELVSDKVMSGLVLQRIDRDDCARGFILEGYPRRLEQAELRSRLVKPGDRDPDQADLPLRSVRRPEQLPCRGPQVFESVHG